MKRSLPALVSALIIWGGTLSAQERATLRNASPATDRATLAAATEDDSAEGQRNEGESGGLTVWFQDRVRRMTAPSRYREGGLSPSVGIIVAGSGLSGGVRYERLNAFDTGIGVQVGGALSIRRYQEHYAAIGVLGSRRSSVELGTADSKVSSLFNDSSGKEPGAALYVEARYRDYPRHTYYGGGMGSRKTDRADYALAGVSVEGVWQRQFDRSLGLSVRGGVLDLRVGEGRNESILDFEQRFDPASVPGAVHQPRFVTLGAGLVIDTRRMPAAPEDGSLVAISLRRFAAANAPALDFTRFTLDVRTYATPPLAGGVVALRGLFSSDVTGGDGSTPFYLQQSLGGGETLRGFRSYRFQGEALLHFTAEYRWRVHRFVEVAPFIDAGTVAGGLSRLALHSFRATPGIAVRARTDHRTLARVEWATGSEGYRIVLGTGPLF